MFDRRKQDDLEPAQTTDRPESVQRPNPIVAKKTAVIGASITIKGDITGDENLVVDGRVEGSVELPNHDLTVGDSGALSANLQAKTIQIHGQVEGDIEGAELVVVSRSGRVRGNIVAPRVTLEDGAQFKGSIDMGPAATNESAAPTSKSSAGGDQDNKQEDESAQAVA